MSSNFLRIAAPVTTSHDTYTNLSKIKPMKEERNRRSTCKDGVSKYMETNWGGKIGGKKKYQPEQALSIENFNTLDSTKDEHIFAFDDTNPSLRIFAKVSRKFAKRHLVSKNNIKVLRKFAPEILPEVRSVAVSMMIMLSLELDQKDYLPIMVCTYSKVM
eukprot:jgi/Psemu1/310782/fgenesh1_kg.680_\